MKKPIGVLFGMNTSAYRVVSFHKCHFCGVEFNASRDDAKFCSGKCRMRMTRWRKKLAEHTQVIDRRIELLSEFMKFPDMFPAAVECLKLVEEKCHNVRETYRIRKVR